MKLIRDDGTECSAPVLTYLLSVMADDRVYACRDRILADPGLARYLLDEPRGDVDLSDMEDEEQWLFLRGDGGDDFVILFAGVGSVQVVFSEDTPIKFQCVAVGGEGRDYREELLSAFSRRLAERHGIDVSGGDRGSA